MPEGHSENKGIGGGKLSRRAVIGAAAALAYLRRWGAEFQEPFQGVVIVPLKGLGPKVVLTAWRRRLDLNPFDPAAAAAFIDRYRGRGPERQVR